MKLEKYGSPADLALASAGAISSIWKYYKPELVTGGLVASALAYDLLCKPGGTISEAVDGIIDKHPVATRVAIGATALHLANAIPEKYDVISQAFKQIKK